MIVIVIILIEAVVMAILNKIIVNIIKNIWLIHKDHHYSNYQNKQIMILT